MRRREVFQPGTTGTPASPVIELDGDPDDIGFEFVVEVIGATPSITFKWQGSLNGTDWFDYGYITDASSVESFAARTVTTVSASVQWRSNALRRYRFVRCVPSANTNVTFRAALIEFD